MCAASLAPASLRYFHIPIPPPTTSTMSLSRVNVQSMKGGLARDIPVDLQHDTIAVLKRRVAASFGGFMHTSEMKLVYKAKALVQESATLSEVGIKAETTVHLVFRLHGGGYTGEMEVLRQVRAARRAGLYGVQQIEVDESDPLVVNIAMEGSSNTPFEGRQLFLSLTFPSTYPASPPRIAFQHPIYHPNVHESGAICWSDSDNTGSSYNLEGIIGMVNTLLSSPNPDDPANREAAKLYVRDKDAWAREARKQAEDALFRL